jgi:hypothetical protein
MVSKLNFNKRTHETTGNIFPLTNIWKALDYDYGYSFPNTFLRLRITTTVPSPSPDCKSEHQKSETLKEGLHYAGNFSTW